MGLRSGDARQSATTDRGQPTLLPVQVAVIDSGWDRSIPDARVLQGHGFVERGTRFALRRSEDDDDLIGHGTACADLVLQVAPAASIIPLRVFDRGLETSAEVLVAALDAAISIGVQVINMSLGTYLEAALIPLYRATERARQNGIVVVASAYNRVGGGYPSVFHHVIGVDLGGDGGPFDFQFTELEAADCRVTNVARAARTLRGECVDHRGTSFAAPVITGKIATLLGSQPGASLHEVKQFLAKTATIR